MTIMFDTEIKLLLYFHLPQRYVSEIVKYLEFKFCECKYIILLPHSTLACIAEKLIASNGQKLHM